MSYPKFVIVSDEEGEPGGDHSVHTAVLDEMGKQRVVPLSEAGKFLQIPPEPRVTVIPRKGGYPNASKRTKKQKCDLCGRGFVKPCLLRKHLSKIHNCQAKDRQTESLTNPASLATQKLVPTAEEIREQKLKKLVVTDPSLISQIKAELDSLQKSEPKRPRYISRRKYLCSLCSKAFQTPSLLERHRSVHTRERLFPCPHCTKRCAYSDERLRHIRRAHPEIAVTIDPKRPQPPSAYICGICDGKRFTTRYRYTEHLRVHLNGLFECSDCGKKYAKRDNLVRHMQIHNGGKNNLCDVCGKSFPDVLSLRNHQRDHTGDRLYNCALCQNSFSKKSNLYKHLQMHTEDNRLKVLKCNPHIKSVPDREHLEGENQAHVSKDTGKGNVVMSESNSSSYASYFRYRSEMAQHIQTQHSWTPLGVNCSLGS